MQPSKAFSQMLVTEEGIVTEVKDVQSLKTPALISVIPLGIVIVARLWQPINAAFSMTADSGSVIEVRAVHRWKALCMMRFSVEGSVTDVRVVQLPNAISQILVTFILRPLYNNSLMIFAVSIGNNLL